MKKLFIAIMAVFALALVGCGSSTDVANEPEPAHEQVHEPSTHEEAQESNDQDEQLETELECSPMVDESMCDQIKKDFSENYDEDGNYIIDVPVQTQEPIDPDKAYSGSVDEADGFVTLNMAAIMNYDDGLSVTLEQLEAIAGDGVGCLEVDAPCYVVLKVYIDNSESSNDYDPSVDTRSVPVIEYNDKSGEKVVAESSDSHASGSSYADNTDGGKLGTVAAGDYGEFYLYYKLDSVQVVDGVAYRAYFEDSSEYATVWVQEEGQNF